MNYFYCIYNRTICCKGFELLQCSPLTGRVAKTPTVTIEFIRKKLKLKINWYHKIREQNKTYCTFGKCKKGYVLHIPHFGIFYIFNQGKNLKVYSFKKNKKQIQGIILNQVLPMALSLKSDLVLHASCVLINNKAYAFVGTSGVGKSTLVSEFVKRNYKFIADDALVLNINSKSVLVDSSFAEVRLFKNEILIKKLKANHFTPEQDKFRLHLSPAFKKGRFKLEGVFVLNRTSKKRGKSLTHLNLGESLPFLLDNLYRIELKAKDRLREEFNYVSQLSRRVNIFKLELQKSAQKNIQLIQGIIDSH